MNTFKQFISESKDKLVPLDQIHTWQARSALSKKQVEFYRNTIRNGGEIRPVHVITPARAKEKGMIEKSYKTNKPYTLRDGHHRVEAHYLEGKNKIRVVE